MTGAAMIFDGVVASLLAAMIFYAVKLNRRIAGMREQESAMQEMINQFNLASAQAASAASQLKQAGDEAEASLRMSVDRARALRDELAFMIERGGQISEGMERSLGKARQAGTAAAQPAAAPEPRAPAAAAEEPRSEAERELLKAMREKRMAR